MNKIKNKEIIFEDGIKYIGEVEDDKPHGKGKLYKKNGEFITEIEYFRGGQIIYTNASTKKRGIYFLKITSEDELKYFQDWEIVTLQVFYYKDLSKLLNIISKMKISWLDLFINSNLMDNPYDKNPYEPWWRPTNVRSSVHAMHWSFSTNGFKTPSVQAHRKIDITNLTKINKTLNLKVSLYPFISKDLAIFQSFQRLSRLNICIYSSNEKKFELDLSKLKSFGSRAELQKKVHGSLSLFLPRFPVNDFVSLKTLNIDNIANLSLYGYHGSDSILNDIESITKINNLSTLTIVGFQNVENFNKLLICKDLKKIYLNKLLIEKIDKELIAKFNEKKIDILLSQFDRFFI